MQIATLTENASVICRSAGRRRPRIAGRNITIALAPGRLHGDQPERERERAGRSAGRR